jgi:glucose-1-phosphate thymidylyltransferase
VQVIVPLAGKGTRLRPHTHLVPKPLIKVAGRPVMDWVMDKLEGLDVTELICITGHLKDQVEAYVRRRYRVPSRFVEQMVQDGTAGAINLARPFVTGPVFIIFVDTVFDADLSIVRHSTDDAIIWAREVEDYQRFGVIVTDADGYMVRIVEKPSEPISKLANIGLYYVRDVDALWQGIDHVLSGPPTGDEWYLTDAFQWMIERGRKIRTAEVTGWYDCGALGTTLETNAILLRGGPGPGAGYRSLPAGGTIVEPCHIEPGVVIQQSTVGPNVSVEADTVIRDSSVRDAIIGARCRIERSRLANAMLGDDVIVEGFSGSLSVGSHGEVRG